MALIDTHIRQFLEFISSQKRYSAHTALAYENDLISLKDTLLVYYEVVQAEDITLPMIRSWLAGMKEQALEARSINRKLSAARSFFKYLLRQGVIAKSPAEGIPSLKIKKRLPSYLEQKDMDRLLQPEAFGEEQEDRQVWLMLHILYQTGLRIQELLQLRYQNVDNASRLLRVRGKGNKERLIPVGDELLKEIARFREKESSIQENPHDHIFVDKRGNPYSSRKAYSLIRKRLDGITTLEKRSPHVLRHTFATHLSENGASINAIKELLGHSSLAATQVYTHTGIEALKEIHKKSHPRSAKT